MDKSPWGTDSRQACYLQGSLLGDLHGKPNKAVRFEDAPAVESPFAACQQPIEEEDEGKGEEDEEPLPQGGLGRAGAVEHISPLFERMLLDTVQDLAEPSAPAKAIRKLGFDDTSSSAPVTR